MARFPKPPEGSWTEHYPELGTGPVSYEDSISPEFYELGARGHLQARLAQRRPGRAASAHRQLLHQGAEGRQHVDHRGARRDGEVRAFHNICRHRGNKLVWNDMPLEETSGTCRQFTCKYHGWRYDLDGTLTFVQQEGEFFDLDKSRYGLVPVHCDVWEGFIFVNFAEEPEQSLREFLGPMIIAWGLSVRQDDLAVVLPVGGQGELEALHGRVPGVLSRTDPAREPVADEVLDSRGAGRLRGAALPDRRSAPAGEHVRYPRVGDGPRDAQADRGHLPAAAFSGRGTSRTSARCRRDSTRPSAIPWGLDSFQLFPNFVILIWGQGWYLTYHYWPTSYNTHVFEGTLYFPGPRTPRERIAQELAAVSFKEFGLQDANTLEATQTMVESRAVTEFLLNDQEVLLRHLHKRPRRGSNDYQRSSGRSDAMTAYVADRIRRPRTVLRLVPADRSRSATTSG